MTTNFVNPELATGMAACPIPPSHQEQLAVNELASRMSREYSDDAVSAKVRKIERDAAEMREMRNPSIKTFSNEVIERFIRKQGDDAA